MSLLLPAGPIASSYTAAGGGGTFVSATFDGSADYVNTDAVAFGPTSGANYTGAMIIQSSTTATGYILTSGDIRNTVRIVSNGDLEIKCANSGGTGVFRYFNDASAGGYDFGNGNEYQVVWKYNGSAGTAQVYVNHNGGGWVDRSADVTLNTASETVDYDNTAWAVGARSTPSDYYNGVIKVIRIWEDQNPDLSSSTVRDNMLAFTQGLGTTPLLDLGFATLGEWNSTDINLGDSLAACNMQGAVT